MKKTSKLSPDLIRLLGDVDGVFFDFVDEYRAWYSKVSGRPISELPYANCWDFYKEQWGLPTVEFLEIYAAGVLAGEIFVAPPIPGTVDALHRIAAAGVSINLVTARLVKGAEEESIAATERWVKKWGVPHDTLTIVGMEKRETALELELNMAVDDAVHHYEELDEIGVDVYLYDRPWNQYFPGRRVADLDDLYRVITAGT